MSPSPEYRYTLDESYLREGFARHQSTLPAWRRLLPRLIFPGFTIVLGIWMGWRTWGNPLMFAAVMVGLGIGTWSGLRQQRKLRINAFRGTVLENAVVRLVPDREGFEVFTASTHVRSKWSQITTARVFRDGLLLMEGAGTYRWLPDSALTGADRESIRALLEPWVADCAAVT